MNASPSILTHKRQPEIMTEQTATTEEPLFEDDELAQFDADDVTAGGAICKMLSLFFLYTVIAMALVGYWTYSSLME